AFRNYSLSGLGFADGADIASFQSVSVMNVLFVSPLFPTAKEAYISGRVQQSLLPLGFDVRAIHSGNLGPCRSINSSEIWSELAKASVFTPGGYWIAREPRTPWFANCNDPLDQKVHEV